MKIDGVLVDPLLPIPGHTLNWWVEIKPGWPYFDLPLGSQIKKCRVFRSWKLPCQAFPSEFVVSARFVPTLDGSNRQCCCNVGWIPTPVYHVCFLHLFVLCPLDQLDKMQVSVSHKMLVKSTPSSIFWWSKHIILIHFAVWIRPITKSKHWKQLTFFPIMFGSAFLFFINQNESLQNHYKDYM